MTTRVNDSLTRMKAVTESSFSDTCSIHVAEAHADSFGQSKKTSFTTTDNVSCGWNPSNTERGNKGQVITFDADGILRLSLTQSFSLKDEFTIRDVRYKCNGITIGLTCKRILGKRVSPNG